MTVHIWSPSVWREWIEMLRKLAVLLILQSPSVWREWIEMSEMTDGDLNMLSPSVWREWIEMPQRVALPTRHLVSLRVEGVD